MFLNSCFPFLLCIIAVNSYNFQLTLIFLISFLQIRNAFDTPAAPTSPKIQDDIFTFQRRKREVLSINIFQGKFGSRSTFLNLFLCFPTFFLFFVCLLDRLIHGGHYAVAYWFGYQVILSIHHLPKLHVSVKKQIHPDQHALL